MLARIKTKTLDLLDVRIESSKDISGFACDDEETLVVVNLDALCGFFSPLPTQTWQRVTGVCNTLSPLYANFHGAISQDFENVAQLLLDLEDSNDCEIQDALPVGVLQPDQPTLLAKLSSQSSSNKRMPSRRTSRKRRASSVITSPLVIPSTHSSTPTIIITPASMSAQDFSCRVPLQDSAFGDRLPIPLHPVFNPSDRPHNPPKQSLNPHARTTQLKWEFVNGRRKTILPSIEEQVRLGMFSRPIIVKRKPARRPRIMNEA